MPALAGLLMLTGMRAIKARDLTTVWKAGLAQMVVLAVTFALTMLMPLQYAVLIGVGLSIVLHVVPQSNQVSVRHQILDADGHLVEVDLPSELLPSEVVVVVVVVLQPYGSLFFAAAPVIEATLLSVEPQSSGSVVILRLRGRTDLGTMSMDALHRYAKTLAADSNLVLSAVSDRVPEHYVSPGSPTWSTPTTCTQVTIGLVSR